MNSELKKDFAMRISQANNVQMIIISYEMIVSYLEEACETDDKFIYSEKIELSKRCIDEMMRNLHYEYEISKNLKELYLYMKRRLRIAVWNDDIEAVKEVIKLATKLKEAYLEIANQDESSALMQNTQSVVTGITYGRNQVLDEVTNGTMNRGYRV